MRQFLAGLNLVCSFIPLSLRAAEPLLLWGSAPEIRLEFRMCQAFALLQGIRPKDIHDFIRMVPMADAEIVRLQQEEGFACMR